MFMKCCIVSLLNLLLVNSENVQTWTVKSESGKKSNISNDNIINRFINNSEDDKSNFDKFKVDNVIDNMRVNLVPDAYLDTLQLISKNGYPAESHTVKTDDGYLLAVHRIPHSKNAQSTNYQAVFLQHGLLGSSSNFVTSGQEKGLAYILSDAGYDVWLGNFRGNTYSRAHDSLSPSDSAFWRFSWDESAVYDLPAMIDYINDYKGNQTLLYIGHSMGTTTLFALLSARPEYNKILKAGFALAPVTYMTDIQSPIRFFAPFSNDIEWIAEFLGANNFFPQSVIFNFLGRELCELNHISKEICENVIFLICGYDDKEFNKDFFKIILSHTPAGTSTRTVVHYAQEIRDQGKFQRFDYGSGENLKVYGQKTPPEYPLNNITLPIALFCADNDWLAGKQDMKKLYKQLKNPIEYYNVPMKDFNHLDFLWATDAPTLVYSRLLKLLKEYKTV